MLFPKNRFDADEILYDVRLQVSRTRRLDLVRKVRHLPGLV